MLPAALDNYLKAALAKLEQRRPEMPADSSPSYEQVRGVLDRLGQSPKTLRALADIRADLLEVSFPLAHALWLKDFIKKTRGERDVLADTAWQTWNRAKHWERKTGDPQRMFKAAGRPEAYETRRKTEMIARLTRTPLKNVVAGALNEWPTSLAHSGLYQHFKYGLPKVHRKAHDEVIVTVLGVFGLLQAGPKGAEIESLKRQRSRLRKKHPFLFAARPFTSDLT